MKRLGALLFFLALAGSARAELTCPGTALAPPTYAVFGADRGGNISVSGGGLTLNNVAEDWDSARANMGKSTGKHYFEGHLTVQNGHEFIGVAPASADMTAFLSGGYAWNHNNSNDTGSYFPGPVSAPTFYDLGDYVGVAWDADAGKLWFSKNGTWISGSPSAGTSPSMTGVIGTFFPAVSLYGGSGSGTTWVMNFGASSFAHAQPTGFEAGWKEPGPWRCVEGDEVRFVMVALGAVVAVMVALGAAGGVMFVKGW